MIGGCRVTGYMVARERVGDPRPATLHLMSEDISMIEGMMDVEPATKPSSPRDKTRNAEFQATCVYRHTVGYQASIVDGFGGRFTSEIFINIPIRQLVFPWFIAKCRIISGDPFVTDDKSIWQGCTWCA